VRRSFERSFDALGQIFAYTREFFQVEGVDEAHRSAVDFAIEEIFTNMVKYHPGATTEIQIDLERDGGCLRVTLTDRDVEPFDVNRAPEAPTDVPLEERKIGGLGLQLTRKLMSSVSYEHDRRTTRIVMTKELE
jgi:serine/threonine-protein kinase RsbW